MFSTHTQTTFFMLGFRNKSTTPDKDIPDKAGLFSRLRSGLARTRHSLTEGVATVVLGSKAIDDELLEEIETTMLLADVGVDATREIIDDLTQRISRKELGDAEALMQALHDDMQAILAPCSVPLTIPVTDKPHVILMVGINGAGKTTTIGKLTRRLKDQGLKPMLAAGDTFRAAAIEQLQTWGERNDVPVIAQHQGADAASVIYDALQSAQARDIDVLIADTAGRLHTQSNLMEELIKIKRVLGKLDENAPHEVMLVVDAGTGQNALTQAQQFHEALGLTGITLTKLDGTAKGGIVFAIAKKLGIPIRFIGVGEGIENLREFNAREFVDALFATEQQ
ncbi:MAG: signal recognition particle-docking protein FtsY [Gammaproteobacteria bacterium]|nr:MAG: signal recognition particle-docking protein FtsY [Gammaproteobacteria bacterium]